MPTYRLLTGTHTIKGVTYIARDKERNTLDLTDKQAKGLEGRLQLISQTETNTSTFTSVHSAPVSVPTSSSTLVTGFFASEWNAERLASATAPELIEGVSRVSDLELLDAIHTEEERGKARKTVLQAITDKYKEVEESQNKA